MKKIFYYQAYLYAQKIIRLELIWWYYQDFLNSFLGIKKTLELIAQKYYKSIFNKDVELYVRHYDISFATKIVRSKLYRDILFLSKPLY